MARAHSSLTPAPALARPTWRLGEFSRYGLSTALCLVVLITRSIKRLDHANLWAEDGAIFLTGALNDGLASLLTSYRGYYHTVGRLLAWLCANALDLRWYPLATSVICLLISAAVFSVLTLDRYRWLLPSDLGRGLLALLICLAPGSWEVFGNFANLHWILFLYAWLLAIKPPEARHGVAEIVLLTLVCLSAGEVVVLLPMFAWRLWQRWRSRLSAPRALNLAWIKANGDDLLCMGLIAAVAILNFTQRDSNPPGEATTLGQLVTAVLCTLSQHLVYLPWLGTKVYLFVAKMMNRNFTHLWALLILGVGVARLWRQPDGKGKTLLLGLACALGVPLLTFIVRPESALWYGRRILPAPEHYSLRYYFVMAPFAVVFWGAVVATAPARVRDYLVVLLAVAYMQGAGPLFWIRSLGSEHDWQEDVQPLVKAIATGCPSHVAVPIYPPSWAVDYHSKRQAGCG